MILSYSTHSTALFDSGVTFDSIFLYVISARDGKT